MNAGKLWVIVAVLGLAVSAFAATPAAPAATQTKMAPATPAADNEVFGGVGYAFWTDYGWRGVNMTKFLGGHSGTGANQMLYNLGMNVKDVGKVGVSLEQVYFDRYDNTAASLAFTNWNVYVKREFEGVQGQWTFGYGNHLWENVKATFPRGDGRSQEFYVTYGFDDAELWKSVTGNETGNILNPSVTYLVDTDATNGGQLAILNLNHPFNMAEVDSQLAGVSLIPTFSLTWDQRYYGDYFNSLTGAKGADQMKDTSKIGYMDYGVKAVADLTGMLGITTGKLNLNSGVGYLDGVELSDAKWYGTVGVSYNF
jgi:hypothetical protein